MVTLKGIGRGIGGINFISNQVDMKLMLYTLMLNIKQIKGAIRSRQLWGIGKNQNFI